MGQIKSTNSNVQDVRVPEGRLHISDSFLSETLKSDYLKTMQHYKPSCACINNSLSEWHLI